MWLTSGIAVAVVEACELPHAAGAALKRKQNETKKKFSGLFLFSVFFFVCLFYLMHFIAFIGVQPSSQPNFTARNFRVAGPQPPRAENHMHQVA